MKILPLVMVAALFALPMRGQPYNPDQLEQLVAPIALYPDPIVALILPASTFPSDVTLASRYAEAGGDPSAVGDRPWDASVKALIHYPGLLKWMDDNLEWTQALGAAVAFQQADVMRAIQSMRARALATGALVSLPQQRVVVVGGIIRIVPGDELAIYLPQYDPDIVYGAGGQYQGSPITFGIALPVGGWLAFECDWDDFAIWTGPWHRGWDDRRDWRNPGFGGIWRAGPVRPPEGDRDVYRPSEGLPRPRPVGGGGAPVARPPPLGWGSSTVGRGQGLPGERRKTGEPVPPKGSAATSREPSPATGSDGKQDKH
jgi:hypothetical protein